jgi:hypothetical protein
MAISSVPWFVLLILNITPTFPDTLVRRKGCIISFFSFGHCVRSDFFRSEKLRSFAILSVNSFS